MRVKSAMIVVGLLVFASGAMAAPDCKVWIPLLPETFDGIPRRGKPAVRDADFWAEKGACSVSQFYQSKDYSRYVEITVMEGGKELWGSYLIMYALSGAEGSGITRETISGQVTLLQFDKKEKKGYLRFSPREKVQVELEVPDVSGKEEMVRLGKLLPFAGFAKTR